MLDENDSDTAVTLRSLRGLTISVKFMALFLIIFSSLQYDLDTNYSVNNLLNERILLNQMAAHEEITALTIISRSLLNIEIDLEPRKSTYIEDRDL